MRIDRGFRDRENRSRNNEIQRPISLVKVCISKNNAGWKAAMLIMAAARRNGWRSTTFCCGFRVLHHRSGRWKSLPCPPAVNTPLSSRNAPDMICVNDPENVYIVTINLLLTFDYESYYSFSSYTEILLFVSHSWMTNRETSRRPFGIRVWKMYPGGGVQGWAQPHLQIIHVNCCLSKCHSFQLRTIKSSYPIEGILFGIITKAGNKECVCVPCRYGLN